MNKIDPRTLEKIQKKLTKLLALSASPNEAEAALAMQKCQELMDKYNISSIDVDQERNTVTTSSVWVQSNSNRKRMPKWVGYLSTNVAHLFSCIVVSRHTQQGWSGFTIVGGTSDLTIVQGLLSRLRHIIAGMGRVYVKERQEMGIPLHSKSRETYCLGVAMTVVERLNSLHSSAGKELVVMKQEFVQRHCDSLFPNKKTGKYNFNINNSTDHLALSRGLQDGANVKLQKEINAV